MREALDAIEEISRPAMEAAGTSLATLDLFERDGRLIEAQLRQIVHGERSPRDFNRRGMRRWLRIAWKTETPAAMLHDIASAERPTLEGDDEERPTLEGDEEDLVDEEDDLIEEIQDEAAELCREKFGAEPEAALAIGTMTFLGDRWERSDDSPATALALARIGYVTRFLEVKLVEGAGAEEAVEIYPIVHALAGASERWEGEESEDIPLWFVQACMNLAEVAPGLFELMPGLSPQARDRIGTSWINTLYKDGLPPGYSYNDVVSSIASGGWCARGRRRLLRPMLTTLIGRSAPFGAYSRLIPRSGFPPPERQREKLPLRRYFRPSGRMRFWQC